MLTFGAMQFAAAMLMSLLTIKLFVFQHGKCTEGDFTRRSRHLMGAATALLAVHFLIQLMAGLRTIGTTQAAMVNLLMLPIASYLFAVAVLLLQRKGRLSWWDLAFGPMVCGVVVITISTALTIDGMPFLSDSPELRVAEYAGAALYMAMQGYYTVRHTTSLWDMRRYLADYYDHDTSHLLRWMQWSIVGLMILALMVPFSLFSSGVWLLVIAISTFFFVFYLVDSFCSYVVSTDSAQICAAADNEDDTEPQPVSAPEETIPAAAEDAVNEWIMHGGYLKCGILQPDAANEIGISKYFLKKYLHFKGFTFCNWIALLRVEEAKRILKAHREWSADAVAEHCGFSDRTVLQRTFKKFVGVTPAQWAENTTLEK